MNDALPSLGVLAQAIDDLVVWNRPEWLGTVDNVVADLVCTHGKGSEALATLDPHARSSAVAAGLRTLTVQDILAEVTPGVWRHRMHETPPATPPVWLKRPAADGAVFPIRTVPPLQNVDKLQYRVGAGLEFSVGGRAFGPYPWPDDGRGWLTVAAWGCEGGGRTVEAAIFEDMLVFRSVTASMPIDCDDDDDEGVWHKIERGPSSDLRFFCFADELPMMYCMEVHALIARSLFVELARSLRIRFADTDRLPFWAEGLMDSSVDAYLAAGLDAMTGKTSCEPWLAAVPDRFPLELTLRRWAAQLHAAAQP